MGFIGESGAGKSTLVDLILGLLSPDVGSVRVDNLDVQSNLRGWQSQIGYVPQSVFLTDDTLRRNVAFGLPSEEIDEAAVWQAIRAAQLERFVLDLPLGLDSVVGERGVRLSGGSYCFSHDLELEIVDKVRSTGLPWINFFCDSLYAFHTVEELARRTSLNWFVETGAVARYKQLGVPYLCAPYALNPRALPDTSCNGAERALAFVGTANRKRARTMTLLRMAGVDVHVSGWGWREALGPRPGAGWGARTALKSALRFAARSALHGRVVDYLDDGAFLAYLRTSQTLLGLSEGGLPSVRCLKLRDIEFPGLGCCYLTQHNQDVENAFEIGREVRTFRTLWEARQIARELDRDPVGCRRMGRRARERVLGEHTWSARLPQLMKSLR